MKSKNNVLNKLLFLVYPILFLVYCFICSRFPGHSWDQYCWREWVIFDVKNGFWNAYKSWTDYLPLYHYVLYFFGKIHGGNLEAISHHIYQLRYFTLLCEFVGGFFLLKLTYEKYENIYKSIAFSMIYFANLFLFYNTIVWGQVDGVLASFVFISFFFAYKQKIIRSALFFILALNMKLQAIVFLPPIGLMLLPLMIEKFSWKNLSKWVIFPVLLQILIITPFIVSGDVGQMWKVVTNSMGKYPVVSMNAFNIWDLLLKGNLMEISDEALFCGISYKHWGLFMFFTSSFFALFYLLKYSYLKIKKIKTNLSLEKLLLICSLIPLLFFYFNTQMHERYLHPSLIFLAMYTILSKRPLPYIILNITYFANLEGVLNHFEKFHDIPRMICSILYLAAIIFLFIDLFRHTIRKNIFLKSQRLTNVILHKSNNNETLTHIST